MTRRATPRPFLKWVGGKRQLINELLQRMPRQFQTYHEPFVGGGALLFALYKHKRIERAYISDLNQELIDTYIAIRDDVENVTAILEEYPHDKAFFYELRAKDPWHNMTLPQRAARMIYLNKTGFNGLYRVNRQGKFNVPFGRYKSPKYYDPENLAAVSNALKTVEIACEPFEQVLKRTKAGDFVYFDPPYAPLSDTSDFTAYQAHGFSQQMQEQLRDLCLELTEKEVKVMVSNSNVPLITQLYTRKPFSISQVSAKRAINSNPAKRGKLAELLITN